MVLFRKIFFDSSSHVAGDYGQLVVPTLPQNAFHGKLCNATFNGTDARATHKRLTLNAVNDSYLRTAVPQCVCVANIFSLARTMAIMLMLPIVASFRVSACLYCHNLVWIRQLLMTLPTGSVWPLSLKN